MLRGFAVSALALSVALGALQQPARADGPTVTMSRGFGILYLPMMVAEDQKLIEKHAQKLGLQGVTVSWLTLDGGNVINDAMLAGSLNYASIGVAGFLTLWSKAKGNPNVEIIGVSGLSRSALLLNTNNPKIKSLKDFGPSDKIALPGIKTSQAAVVLEMAAAKEFGYPGYDRLDPFTVGLAHPDAYASLVAGRGSIDAHFGSPPYSNLEIEKPGIHTVFDSTKLLGDASVDVVYTTRKFNDANPKITEAVIAALDEANAYIRKNHRGAAEAYLRVSKAKAAPEDIMKMLDDPKNVFSTTPTGTMIYADFMHKVGSIKTTPATWKDLFVPAIQSRPGS
jgi:NitT/TauT family transport system substrate-binding protein